jgi:hypothetical protein
LGQDSGREQRYRAQAGTVALLFSFFMNAPFITIHKQLSLNEKGQRPCISMGHSHSYFRCHSQTKRHCRFYLHLCNSTCLYGCRENKASH